MAFLIAAIFGYRWKLLLGGILSRKNSFIASIISLGVNMFLPAPGAAICCGCILVMAGKFPHAQVLGRLLLRRSSTLSASLRSTCGSQSACCLGLVFCRHPLP